MDCILNATEALDSLKEKGIILTCAGATLYASPRSLITREVNELIQRHKSDLLTLLRGESVEAPAVERQAEAAGGESHVPAAVPSQSLSPAPCPHAAVYRRPSGVAVCLACAKALAPGAPDWQPQTITSCEPGTHVWVTGCEAHPGVLQCAKCPEVHAARAAGSQRDPAVHDPQCPGGGLVVTPGSGWSCPQCTQRYVVPEAPAASTPAQAALPLGSGVQHGEVVPSKRRR